MPNRIIKESICTSDSIDALTWFEEVLYYRLIVNCDDYGRFDGRTAVIKNRLFPLKDNVTVKSVETSIDKLVTCGLVTLYEFEGKPYLQLPTWDKHQTVRAKKSKYPPFDRDLNTDEIICKQMQANASKCFRNPIQYESNTNTNARDNARTHKKFVKPTLEEVKAYCSERKNGINAEYFISYYDSRKWRGVDDWQAKVRAWETNGIDNKPNTTKAGTAIARTFDPEEAFKKALERGHIVES